MLYRLAIQMAPDFFGGYTGHVRFLAVGSILVLVGFVAVLYWPPFVAYNERITREWEFYPEFNGGLFKLGARRKENTVTDSEKGR